MRPFRIKATALPYACEVSKFHVDSFHYRWLVKEKPVKYDCKTYAKLNTVPARAKWFEPYRHSSKNPFLGPFELNYDYLKDYGQVTVPIERTVWGDEGKSWEVKSFEQFDAPLSFFLEWTKQKQADPLNFSPNESLYIAQSSIDSLPNDLRLDLPAPVYCTSSQSKLKKKALKITLDQGLDSNARTVEASSIWLGLPPTETPLHKDPNHNFFLQLAGYKTIRLVTPDDGEFMLAYVKREVAMQQSLRGGLSRLNISMRGEEMMVGPERALMSELVWEEKALDGQTKAARLLEQGAPAQEAEVEDQDEDAQSAAVEDGSGVEAPEAVASPGSEHAKSNSKSSKPDEDDVIKIWETTLSPGDALYIPKGWYHSVRSLGSTSTGINASANWWFRPKFDSPKTKLRETKPPKPNH
jgi:hypothetical protein